MGRRRGQCRLNEQRNRECRTAHADPPLHQIMTFCNVLVIRTPTFATLSLDSVCPAYWPERARADLARDVVEQRDAHQQDQECDPDLLAEHLRALGERAALQPLHELEHHLTAIEYWNRQQVQEPEAQRNEHQEIQERHRAVARGFTRELGDRQRAARDS